MCTLAQITLDPGYVVIALGMFALIVILAFTAGRWYEGEILTGARKGVQDAMDKVNML